MGRPKLEAARKKTDAVQLRLNASERVAFDRLRLALADELPGVDLTDAGAVRAVVVQAMKARGIDWPVAGSFGQDAPTRPRAGSPPKKTRRR